MIRILVVDDDPKLNQAACTYLNDCGYEAKGCLSAEAAYDAMYSQLFDLIISDIMMPGTDGFEFAETIRGLNKTFPFCLCRRGTTCRPNRRDLIWALMTTW